MKTVDEKRRFFRINETIGLSYEILGSSAKEQTQEELADIWALMSEQDDKIEHLLNEVAGESPKIAALVRALNQKVERVVGQLVMESRLVDRLASRVKEVSISACGIGFVADRHLDAGTRLKLELQLFPSKEKIFTKGRIVACDQTTNGHYWRIDFFDMSQSAQEQLIQHIVQRQSAQLKERRPT